MFNGDFYWYYRRSRDDSWIITTSLISAYHH